MRKIIFILVGLIATSAFADDISDLMSLGVSPPVASKISTMTSAPSGNLTVGGDLSVTGDSSFTGDLIASTDDSGLFTDTADAADNQCIMFASTSAIGATRGAYARACGNEETGGAGAYRISGGQVSTGKIELITNHASATTDIYGGNGSMAVQVGSSGVALQASKTLTSVATGNVGWTAQAAANQACDTTCTSGCGIGFDAGTNALVTCTDATADTCLCLGSS